MYTSKTPKLEIHVTLFFLLFTTNKFGWHDNFITRLKNFPSVNKTEQFFKSHQPTAPTREVNHCYLDL